MSSSDDCLNSCSSELLRGCSLSSSLVVDGSAGEAIVVDDIACGD